jgi:hypothetical protein
MPPKPLQNIRNENVSNCCLGISDLLLSWPGTIWAEITMRELRAEPRIPKLEFRLCNANFDCVRRFVFGLILRLPRNHEILMDIETSQHHKVMHLVNTSLILAGHRNIDVQIKSRNRSIHLQIEREQHPTIQPLAVTSPIFDNTDLSSKQSCSGRAHFRVTVEWFLCSTRNVPYQSSTFI